MKSASACDGWYRSSQPLMTGTLLYWASSRSEAWVISLAITRSQLREAYLISYRIGEIAKFDSRQFSTTEYPPSWAIADWNDSDVRVDVFSKSSSIPRPCSGRQLRSPAFFISRARRTMESIASPGRSRSFSTCCMGMVFSSVVGAVSSGPCRRGRVAGAGKSARFADDQGDVAPGATLVAGVALVRRHDPGP